MNPNQFSSLLALIVPMVLEELKDEMPGDDTTLISDFYKSKLYAELSLESTKLWHYGPKTLAVLYEEELANGTYEYPEEAC